MAAKKWFLNGKQAPMLAATGVTLAAVAMAATRSAHHKKGPAERTGLAIDGIMEKISHGIERRAGKVHWNSIHHHAGKMGRMLDETVAMAKRTIHIGKR